MNRKKKNKLVYVAPDIDLSKNEGGKSHVLGEIKYLQKHYSKIFLIIKNSNNLILDEQFRSVQIYKIPNVMHSPYFRFRLENLLFILISISLRIKGYTKLIERSYRGGGIFSIFFTLFGGKGIYQLNEPIYYERYIMPFQNFLLKIMGNLNIRFFGTHQNFSYNLPKKKYINGRRGVDLEEIRVHTNTCEKKYDIIYVGSAATWHNLKIISSVMEKNKQWNALIIISGKKENIKSIEESIKSPNLKLLSNINHDKIYKYISQSKIGIALYEKNSELLEKFDYCYSPIKVHEYKACGLPVIASNIGNLKTLVINSGILIKNTEKNLESAIEKILMDKKLYDEYSKSGIEESITKYNRKKITEKYFTLLS